jgi:predicted nucleic acid-binding Zn ribbon protein
MLSTIARHYGLEAKLLEHRLQRRWPEIVGAQIATHTRPDAIRFRKLYLIAENSVWLQQLTFLKPSLVQKINAAAGGAIISEIVLRIGEMGGEAPQVHSEKVKGKSVDPTEQGPSEELLTEVADYAKAVNDPDLRDRLAAVMARALARQPERKAP